MSRENTIIVLATLMDWNSGRLMKEEAPNFLLRVQPLTKNTQFALKRG